MDSPRRLPRLIIGLTAALVTLAAFPLSASAAESGRTLEQEATIPAPVEEVWNAFTTTEGMMPWMQLMAAEVDLRVGGTIRTSYTEKTLGGDSTIVQRILSFEPERMLSLQLEASPKGSGFEILKQTWAVMYFEPLSNEETRIRMVGLGYGEGPEWDAAYTFFEQANPQVFRMLAEHLGKSASSEDSEAEAAPATN